MRKNMLIRKELRGYRKIIKTMLKLRLVILFLFITMSLSWAKDTLNVTYRDGLLYITATNVTLGRLCEEISKKTNVEISLDKGIPEMIINLEMGGLSVGAGMKRLTTEIGNDLAMAAYKKGFEENQINLIRIGRTNDILKEHKKYENSIKDLLKNHIKDKTKETEKRAGSMILLRSNSDEDVRLFFEELLRNDEEPDIRKAAAVCLGYRKDAKKSIPILKNALKDKEKIVGLASAHTLGKMNDDSGYNLAKEALSDNDNELRATALLVLGIIGKEESRGMIENFLNDNNEAVRTRAKAALKNIELKHAKNKIRFLRETLEKSLDNEIQYWAALALTEEGELGIAVLKKIRQDKNYQGRGAAEYVLTEKGIK